MNRTAHGNTIMEALISTVIMGFLSCAFMSVLLVNYKTSAKLDSMQDTINAVRAIKERLEKDVREGRSLGDVYGTDVSDPVTNMTFVQGSDTFPSTADPIYGAGNDPPVPNGWPAANVTTPYQLGNQCLIVQLPILDDHNDTGGKHFRSKTAAGWPTQIPPLHGNPPQDNVETHVYRIVPDQNNPGEFLMQFASFGGANRPTVGAVNTGFTGYSYSAHTFGPETVISGIIGPLDANGNPKVFQFVSPKRSSTPVDTIPIPADVAEYTGVVCNLEIKRHQDMSTKRKDISITPIGMKFEVFLRNNALATSVGQPLANQAP